MCQDVSIEGHWLWMKKKTKHLNLKSVYLPSSSCLATNINIPTCYWNLNIWTCYFLPYVWHLEVSMTWYQILEALVGTKETCSTSVHTHLCALDWSFATSVFWVYKMKDLHWVISERFQLWKHSMILKLRVMWVMSLSWSFFNCLAICGLCIHMHSI